MPRAKKQNRIDKEIGPGRPSKLTAVTRKKVVQSILRGLAYEQACILAGISYRTFRTWIQKGESETSEEYVHFLQDIKKAEAECEARIIQRISNAASKGQWQAGAWLLERRYPDRWGKRDRHVHENPNGGGIMQPIVDAIIKIYGSDNDE